MSLANDYDPFADRSGTWMNDLPAKATQGERDAARAYLARRGALDVAAALGLDET